MKYGPPSPAESLASLFRSRGINLNVERLEDRVATERSRAKVDFDAYRDRVEALALAAKRPRRAAGVAEWAWRRNPNSDTLAAAMAAQKVRNHAEAELREICLNDEQLIADVKRRYGR